ncbi:MAG: PEP-CTERM sorting domain-containing protein, partial [Phycisphaeraceae bacterium]
LAINATSDNGYPGWKTADMTLYPSPYTGNHYQDDAVFYNGTTWQELFDPRFPTGQVSLDLAFVITPEPTSIALLTIGGLALLRRRWH